MVFFLQQSYWGIACGWGIISVIVGEIQRRKEVQEHHQRTRCSTRQIKHRTFVAKLSLGFKVLCAVINTITSVVSPKKHIHKCAKEYPMQ